MDSSLQETIDLLKSTREGFSITEDVTILNHINSTVKKMEQKFNDNEKKQKKELQHLEEEIQTTQFDIDSLQEKIKLLEAEMKQYDDTDQVFSQYAKDIELLQTQNLQLKQEIEDLIQQLIDINDGKDILDTTGSTDPAETDARDQNDTAAGVDKASQNVSLEMSDDKLLDPAVRLNLLQLKLYRSLGVIIDSKTNQVFIKHGDSSVDVLSLDDNYSDYYKTKFIWDRLGK